MSTNATNDADAINSFKLSNSFTTAAMAPVF